MKSLASTLFLVCILVVPSLAQKPTPTPVYDDDDVVKISTKLVQLDAIVLDKKGNPVTDLTAEDFEILQDGKPQKITNFSFISRTSVTEVSEQTLKEKTSNKKIKIPPVSFRPKDTGRVITFVVDDGNASSTFAGMRAVQEGLRKFVNEQMQPNDLVAIFQTRDGSSRLQQYTSDKALLLQVIKKIRWFPAGGAVSNIDGENYDPIVNGFKVNGTQTESEEEKELKERQMSSAKLEDKTRQPGFVDFTMEKDSVGVLGLLRYVIKGLYPVGGRKVLFLLSDSLPNANLEMERRIKEVATLANRASIVLNTLDVRGTVNPDLLTADTDVEGIKFENQQNLVNTITTARNNSDNSRQSGLSVIADETGGKFYQNMNNLNVPIVKALNTEKGYYLLAYEPKDETFKGKNFNKIKLNLKREGLDIRSRSGFYGVTDEEMRPKPRTAEGDLYYALTAPLPNADLNIKVTANYLNTSQKGNLIHSQIFIDGKDITFLDAENGSKKIVFDIVAVTLNEKNELVDDTNRTATVKIPADKLEETKRSGLIYSVDVPVKKDGVYTFRIAVRDKTANRLGTSSQIIEVPNLSKDKLFISGLSISGVDENGVPLPAESGENAFSSVVSPAISPIRKFSKNTFVAYYYSLYNAKSDTATKLPKVLVQTNLYFEGKMIAEGKPEITELKKDANTGLIKDFGYMKLNAGIASGDYVLQVIVKDPQTNQIVSQWIDFEVLN